MSEKSVYIIKRLSETGLVTNLDEETADKLVCFYNLLIYTNKYINLTRITDFHEYVEKHIIDSLEVIHYLSTENVEKCIDIGSGGGFPGLPLAIVYPHIHVVLVDSVGKKVNFINDVVNKLHLVNAKGIHSRAEDLARNKDYREKFDLCTSRAVARFSSLSELCIPFLKVDGLFAAYKSGDVSSEILEGEKAVRVLGGKIDSINQFQLDDMGRSIVIVRKVKNTPNFYPRRAGTPVKNPIV